MNRTSIDEQQRVMGEEPDERTGKRPRVRHQRGPAGEGRGVDVTRLREVGRNLGTQIGEQARKRPYAALGLAAGLGFVAGSLFGSRLGQALLAAGLGYAAKNLLEGEDGVERLQQNIQKIEKLAHDTTNG